MRLFVALDIDEAIRQRISGFINGISELAPAVRWARPDSLHITLKFLGEQPDTQVDAIKNGLSALICQAIQVQILGYGFFPTAKSARVFWLGIDANHGLGLLARDIDEKLAALGIVKEERAFSPHLTLARAVGGSSSPRRNQADSPNRRFQRLQEKLSALPTPEFGSMTAREFFLYQSQLSPKESTYTKLARFDLK